MATELLTPKTHLSPDTTKRIQRHLDALEKRLAKFHKHEVTLTIRDKSTERRFTADALVSLGVDGVELISHNQAETADLAARLAVEDIERQLERYVDTLRGKPSFGTPSRREPKDLRPATQLPTDDDDHDSPPGEEPDEPI